MTREQEGTYKPYTSLGCDCACGKHCGISCMTDGCDCTECRCYECQQETKQTD